MTDEHQQPPQLEYPQILLDISLDSLLSHSSAGIMTSSAPESNLEPDSLLTESWATLSDSDYSREDDLQSETTDLGSLVSNNGAEDVHSIDNDSESEDDEEQPLSHSHGGYLQAPVSSIQPIPLASPFRDDKGIDTSEEEGLSALEFQEPMNDGWPDAGQIDVRHTMRVFNKAEAHQILGRAETSTNPTQLVITLRMSMSRTSLELDRPFRVFYVGTSVARDDILVKIASALLAGLDHDSDCRNMESSRYHVLPQHYGPGAPPGSADLIPIQKTQIIVDEIRSAYYKDEHLSDIEISLKNGTNYSSRRRGLTFEMESTVQSVVPDIALFYTSEDDSPISRRTLRCAHNFMLRHHVPSIIISGEVSVASPPSALSVELRSLHVCVESKASETQESRVLRRLPVDITTFAKLDSKQLNKNLACLIDPNLLIAPTIIRPTTHPVKTEKENSSSGDVEKNLSKSTLVGQVPIYRYGAVIHQVLLSLVFCGLFLVACRTVIPKAASYVGGHGDLVAPSVVLVSAPPSMGQSQSFQASASTPTATTDVTLQRSLATMASGDYRTPFSLPHREIVVNKSDKFQVQVVGDCHMIIKAPVKLKVKRRDPTFEVSVTRGTELLDNLSLSKVFDGVYTVEIDRKDAHGLLNVTIDMTGSGVTEIHEIDFGTHWLRLADWRKAVYKAHRDIGTAQEVASVMAEYLSTTLQRQSLFLSNFTTDLRPLYSGAAQKTKAFSETTRTFAVFAAERARNISAELQISSAHRFLAASMALGENIELAQNTLTESSTIIVRHASKLRDLGVKAIAKAQIRAKQIATERRQRKHLRKAVKATASSRCGRTGQRCSR